MSLFAIKNDEGKYLHIPEAFCDHDWDTRADTWDDREVAKDVTHHHGGHVVELVEKPAPVVVSEEEAEILDMAKSDGFGPARTINAFSSDHGGWKTGSDLEDRLMRAYVNGWVVEKPKCYVLPMPSKGNPDETVVPMFYARFTNLGHWYQTTEAYTLETVLSCRGAIVTQADIDAAPDWVKAIKPVEVRGDDDF